MAKLYTSFDFRDSLRTLVLVNDAVGAQMFFAEELTMRILASGLPINSDARFVAAVGQKVFGEFVADRIIQSCVVATERALRS